MRPAECLQGQSEKIDEDKVKEEHKKEKQKW